MDMSMMMTDHIAQASKRGRSKTFQWAEHGGGDAAARLVAATLVVAVLLAFLEIGGSPRPAGMTAAVADITASTGRHSPR